MGLILAAALALSAQTAQCALSYERDDARGGYPTAIRAECLSDAPDAPALQAVADAMIGRLSLDPPPRRSRRQAYGAFDLAESARFEQDGMGGWRAAPGQKIISRGAQFPMRAVERGADLAYCAVGFAPDAHGAPQALETACLINNGREDSRRQMEAATLEAVSGWRMLPVDMPYCYKTQIATTAGVYFQGRLQPRGPGLDPDDLPELCPQTS